MTTNHQTVPTAAKDTRKESVNRLTVIMDKAGIWIVVALLIIFGGISQPGKFLTVANFTSIAQAISLVGICATGLSFIVYTSHFNDMSLPMTVAFSGMIAVQTLQFGFLVSLFCGLVAGTAIGAINGLAIGKFRAHPIIWSMAFNFVLSGIVRWAWSGNQIYPDVIVGNNMDAAEAFYAISRTKLFGVLPVMVLVMALMFVVSQFVLTRTSFGNQLKIIGSNYEVARLSGIKCSRNIFICYLINAFCASVCGIIIASISKTGAYYNGDGYDFTTVTAVLLGGMTLAGGKGNLIGVFGGVLTVGMLSNIMTLMGVPTFNQWLVQGIVFLLIVWLNTNSMRKMGRS